MPAIEGTTWNHPVLAVDILLIRSGEEMAAFTDGEQRWNGIVARWKAMSLVNPRQAAPAYPAASKVFNFSQPE